MLVIIHSVIHQIVIAYFVPVIIVAIGYISENINKTNLTVHGVYILIAGEEEKESYIYLNIYIYM